MTIMDVTHSMTGAQGKLIWFGLLFITVTTKIGKSVLGCCP